MEVNSSWICRLDLVREPVKKVFFLRPNKGGNEYPFSHHKALPVYIHNWGKGDEDLG